MRRPEQIIQQACVQWFRLQHPDKILFATNNNAQSKTISNKKAGGIAQSMGVLSGVSDLIFCYRGVCTFIEVKSSTGRQSPSQKIFQANVEKQGFKYYIVRNVDEFINVIKKHIT